MLRDAGLTGLSPPLGCGLRGEHALRRVKIDERVGIKMGGNDVRPFVQDEMQGLVARHVKDGNGAAPRAGVEMPANPALLVFGDPRPE